VKTNDAALIAREKTVVALAAARLIESGMRVGLGSGSTALKLVDALGARVLDGLDIVAVATSEQTAARARRWDIPLIEGVVPARLDLVIDGADEFDPALRLIKGGGGMMLREKIVASAAERFVIMVDHTKQVESLGAFPLPVEVVPMARIGVARRLREMGFSPVQRRTADGALFVTDEGNLILDCTTGLLTDPDGLAPQIEGLPGVVEHGLFLAMADEVLLARGETIEVFRRPATAR